MRDFDDAWLDDEPERHSTSVNRKPLIIAAIVAPWLIVAAVLVTTRGSGPPTVVEVPPPAADVPDLAEPEPLGFVEISGGWRAAPGERASQAVAAMAASAWLETQLGEPAPPLLVEAVEQLDPDLAVVTLLGRHGSSMIRVGVAVHVDTTAARPVGDPWLLPELDVVATSLEREVVDDPHLLLGAAEALQSAGYLQVEVHALERTESWPWLVHASARTPSGMIVDTPIALRRHLDGFVTAGTVHAGHHGDLP